MRRPTFLAPLLLAAGYGLLTVVWTAANPPFAAPDEPAHLTRALAVARGDALGQRTRYGPSPEFGPRQIPWINRVARSVDAGPRAPAFVAPCFAFRPEVDASCGQVAPRRRSAERARTYVGTYQPYLYAPPGIAARTAPSAPAAVRAGRVPVATISAAALAAATAAVWQTGSGGWPLLGILLAATPMVVFLGSTLSPNGIEVASGLAFSALTLRLARDGNLSPAAWAGFGVFGALLALSRPTGVPWVAAITAVGLLLTGARAGLGAVRRGGRAGAVAWAAVLVAAVASLAWEVAVQPHPGRIDGGQLLPAFSALPEMLRQSIGVFGWLDTGLPYLAYAAWRVMVLGLVGLALLVGDRRERRAVVLTLAGTVTALVALGVTNAATGFGMQARYVLPILVLVPLVAGEIVLRGHHRLGSLVPALAPAGIGLAVAAIHAVALFTNARRYAVGVRGPLLFAGASRWTPPGGWIPWALIALIAVSALAGAAMAAPNTASGARARRQPTA